MKITDELIQAIKDIRFAGEHPLLQYDIVDAKTMLDVLNTQSLFPNAWQVAKVLKNLGMRRLGLYSIEGYRVHLWTCQTAQPLDEILRRAAHRIRTNATKLETELLIESGQPVPPAPNPLPRQRLTDFEREVLALRLQRHPARRIAALLNSNKYAVYEASESLRVKLRVASLKNRDELKEKGKDALMEDPAFC